MVLESVMCEGDVRPTRDMNLWDEVEPKSQFMPSVVIFKSWFEPNVHVDLGIGLKWLPQQGSQADFLSRVPSPDVPLVGGKLIRIWISKTNRKFKARN